VVAAAQSGALQGCETTHIDALNLDIPVSIPGVPDQYVDPRHGWESLDAYNEQATKLAALFQRNMQKFDVSDAIIAAGPQA
jgi:phosphoenolpyruvate carboxykinase (ATP)